MATFHLKKRIASKMIVKLTFLRLNLFLTENPNITLRFLHIPFFLLRNTV